MVHIVGYFHSCITMHGFMNIKLIDLVVLLLPGKSVILENCNKTLVSNQCNPLYYLAHALVTSFSCTS
jgi:hypothetical protein